MCLGCVRSGALTSHVHCGSAMPPYPLTLLLPVRDSPCPGPVQALAKCSWNTCQPCVDSAAWLVNWCSAFVLKSSSDSVPGQCLSIPSLKTSAGTGWAPRRSLENSGAELDSCYKLHPQTSVLQRCQTLSLISYIHLKVGSQTAPIAHIQDF